MNPFVRSTLALLLFCGLGGAAWAAAGGEAGLSEAAGEASPGASGRLVREGVVIEFAARPVAEDATGLVEDELADLRFVVTDAGTGRPLTGLAPGAWLNLARMAEGRDGYQRECKDRIGLYLGGVLGTRPMVDLNSYFILVLNKDPSITVIDPLISVAGRTSTLTQILLKSPPMDWIRHPDGTRLFVSMPLVDQVAVVDAVGFRVLGNLDAGSNPVRLALQPDGRYLWVGNNARLEDASGVTVIDASSLETVGSFATGLGHHEIAFSGDSRHAFVTNRDAGTVTVFDTGSLERLRDLETGPRPISAAYSSLSDAVYVADGAAGTITVIDAQSLEQRKVIRANSGLGPLRFTRDGRFGLALNTAEDTVTIIDAATDEAMHTVEVAAEPYQVTFTDTYAYIRGLASEQVTMVELASLGRDAPPTLMGFAAGEAAPKLAGDLLIAESLAARNDDHSVFVVNPADNTTYFYMQGMNAPMTSYVNRGFASRAVTVIERSMKEVEPGVFTTRVAMPAAGTVEVAFMLDRPQILHCFSAEVGPGAATTARDAEPRLEFLRDILVAEAGSAVPVRFRLTLGAKGEPRTGMDDLRVTYFLAPSSPRRVAAVTELGDGVYEAQVELSEPGAFFVYVESPSLKPGSTGQTYLTLRAVRPAPRPDGRNK